MLPHCLPCRVSRGAATLPHRLPLRSIPPQRFACGSSHSRGHGRPRSVRKSSRLRWKCLSMDCRCSDIANLSAHLHRLPTPPPYLRRMRLLHGQDAGVRCRRLLPFGWGCGCWVLDKADAWPCSPFLQFTARANPCSRHLWGTLTRAVASICAQRARLQKLIVWL